MALINAALLALAVAGAKVASAQQCTTLIDAVVENDLSGLGGAVQQILGLDAAAVLAPLASTTLELPEEEKITIFAPVNEAFPAELPAQDILAELLFNHVVDQYLPSTAAIELLATGEDVVIDTLGGGQLMVTQEGEDIFISSPGMMEPAQVTMVDIETCAGVIHKIDKLLVPEGLNLDAMAPGMAPGMGPMAAGPAVPPISLPTSAPPVAVTPGEAPGQVIVDDMDGAPVVVSTDGPAAASPDGTRETDIAALGEEGTALTPEGTVAEGSGAGSIFSGAAVAAAVLALAVVA